MRLRHLAIPCVLLITQSIFAQDEIDLSELKSPISPAFTILGQQPSEIARPTSLRSLEAGIFNNFTDQGSFGFPNNYSLEFTPYWLSSKPRVTLEDYIEPDAATSMLQNLSVSFGTVQSVSTTDTARSASSLGFGLRTQVISGKLDEKTRSALYEKIDDLNSAQAQYNDLITPIDQIIEIGGASNMEEVKTTLENDYIMLEGAVGAQHGEKAAEAFNKRVEQLMVKLEDLNAENEDEVKIELEKLKIYLNGREQMLEDIKKTAAKVTEDLKDLNKDYYGFSLEFATALALSFPESRVSNKEVPRWGLWATPAFRCKSKKFEFISLLRYIGEQVDTVNTGNFDIGGKIVFQLEKFSMSGEFIYRSSSTTIETIETEGGKQKTNLTSDDTKAVLNLDYRITPSIVLSYTVGRNMADLTGSEDGFVSVLNLNIGIGGVNTKMLIPGI